MSKRTDNLEKINELIYDIALDMDKASPGFLAIKRAMYNLSNKDIYDEKKLRESAYLLQRAIDSSNVYLKSHSSYRFSYKGQRRATKVKEVRDSLLPIFDEINGIINEKEEKEKATARQHIEENPDNYEARMQIAKLQRNLGVTSFVPKVSEFEPKQSKIRNFFSSLGHKMYSALYAVTTATIGLVEYLFTAPFTTTGKFEREITEEKDFDIVPGSKDEKFEEMNPENGPDKQEIDPDTRRVPTVFEYPIPEDPNQPPTMTIEFEQAEEGSGAAYAYVKNNKGERSAEMGHAYISLCYTKVNPMTGKEERYKSTFGFYPHADFLSTSECVAMGQNGQVIPGEIRNDFGHSYSTGMTYEVSNKQINQVIKAAQKYAEGGYNYVSRSCISFAREMALAANIPANDLFSEVEIGGLVTGVMCVAPILGGPVFSKLGKYEMLKKGQNADNHYQNYGKKKIDVNDIKRLDKREFNVRLKGYTPSHGAESARNNYDFKLHSKRYETKIDANDRSLYLSNYDDFVRIKKEATILVNAVNRVGIERKADFNEVGDKLVAFMQTNIGLIEELYGTVFSEKQKGEPLATQIEDIKKATKSINNFIESLNEAYKTAFKKDADLNIPFQHMVSNLSRLKDKVYSKYFDVQNNIQNGKKVERDTFDNKDIDIFLGEEENTFLKRQFFYGETHINTENYNIEYIRQRELISGLKFCDSYETFFRKNERLGALEFKKKTQGISKEEEKELKELRAFKESSFAFNKGEEFFVSKKKYTDYDIKFSFVELPKHDNEQILAGDSIKPSATYQGLIVGRFMEGFKHDMNHQLLNWIGELDKKITEVNGKYKYSIDPALERDIKGLKMVYGDKLNKMVFDFMADKIQNSDEFDRIVSVIYDSKVLEKGKDAVLNEDEKQSLRNESIMEVTDSIMKNYMNPLVNEMRFHLDTGPNKTVNSDLIKDCITNSIDLKKLENEPSSEKLRKVLNEKAGKPMFKSNEEIAENYKNYSKEEIQGAFEKKKNSIVSKNIEYIDVLRRDLAIGMNQLSKKGKLGLENPEAKTLLAKFVGLKILKNSVEEGKYVLQPITPHMVDFFGKKYYELAEFMAKDNKNMLLEEWENKKSTKEEYSFEKEAQNALKEFSKTEKVVQGPQSKI